MEMKKHDHQAHHRHMMEEFRRKFFASALLTIPVILLSDNVWSFIGASRPVGFAGDQLVVLALSTIIFLYGGMPFLKGAVRELRSRQYGMMLLIGLATTIAYTYSSAVTLGLEGEVFFWELVTLIDVMLLGHWLEMRSVLGAGRALEELAELLPSTAHRLTGKGETEEVPLEDVEPGDTLLVKPGERIPVDGVIIGGESSVNEAMLTGETNPVYKGESDEVVGGSINGEGSLTIRVMKTGEESYISQVIEMVREAQESKSETQDLANRAAKWLTGIAIGVGGLTFFSWLAFADLTFALERAVTVMVITCPHALGLAVPLVVSVSTTMSARNGLLIRDRTAFENARSLDAIVFDKTGTLTKGEFGVSDVRPFGRSKEKTILKYAASVEAHSEHPIARAIEASSNEKHKVTKFRNIPGKGARGEVNGKEVHVVSPAYLEENDIDVPEAGIELMGEGMTTAFVLMDGEPAGAITLEDIIRPESREAVDRLKEMGVDCMMITGDNEHVAERVAAELGLDDYFAEVLPGDKAAKIQEVQARGLKVGMVGDGVNDAPALAQADVGIAIGAGTDVAVETADIVLVRSDPRDVASLIGFSDATYGKMKQNLFWATGYNAVMIPLAAGVLFSYGIAPGPAVAAALMSLSTVIVAVNAKLLDVGQ